MDEIINCRRLAFRYGEVYALHDFSFQVNGGEVVALLGPNGAGKTTSIRVLNGLLQSESGTCTVMGLNPSCDGAKIRARSGVLTETPALYERLTARQNLAFFGALSGLSPLDVERRAKQLLGMFKLEQRANDRVDSFSKGMKQRLALARALLHEPEILFLDEPTSDLDPEAARQVQDLILEISNLKERTVVLCTHHLFEAEQLCDRVAVMSNGHVTAAGTLDELRAQVIPFIRVIFRLANPVQSEWLKAFSVMGGVTDVRLLEAQTFELILKDERPVPAVVELLVKKRVGIQAVEPRKASLEEIYLRLQQNHEEVHA